MFGGLVGVLGRHVRLILALAVIAGAVGAATAIGWVTAPIA